MDNLSKNVFPTHPHRCVNTFMKRAPSSFIFDYMLHHPKRTTKDGQKDLAYRGT